VKPSWDQIHIQHRSIKYVTPFCWPPDCETAFFGDQVGAEHCLFEPVGYIGSSFETSTMATNFPSIRMFYATRHTDRISPPNGACRRAVERG
jgi:hypothetical protein